MVAALSNEKNVIEVADHFYTIANALHFRLSTKARAESENLEDLYSLLTEEYGLRARAGILRNSAKTHIVSDSTATQVELCEALSHATTKIPEIAEIAQLRTLTKTVSTLCVCISPGKGRVIDFMLQELLRDLDPLSMP